MTVHRILITLLTPSSNPVGDTHRYAPRYKQDHQHSDNPENAQMEVKEITPDDLGQELKDERTYYRT